MTNEQIDVACWGAAILLAVILAYTFTAYTDGVAAEHSLCIEARGHWDDQAEMCTYPRRPHAPRQAH